MEYLHNTDFQRHCHAPRRTQRGVSMTAVLLFGLVLMVMSYIALKTVPLVLERFKVDGLMQTLTAPPNSGKIPANDFYRNLVRQLDLQDVRRFNGMASGDFLKVNHPRKKSDKKSITFFYTASENIYKELYVTLQFEQTYIFGASEEE